MDAGVKAYTQRAAPVYIISYLARSIKTQKARRRAKCVISLSVYPCQFAGGRAYLSEKAVGNTTF